MARTRRSRTFFCSRLKKDSLAALPPAAPTRPIEPAIRWLSKAGRLPERNCDPRSLCRMHPSTFPLRARALSQTGLHPRVDGVAHDPGAEGVLDHAEVELALTGGVLGDVGEPQPVRAGRGEVTADEVVVHRRAGLRAPAALLVEHAPSAVVPADSPGRSFRAWSRRRCPHGASISTTSSDGRPSRWPPARPSRPGLGSSRPARRLGGTLPDKAWHSDILPTRPTGQASSDVAGSCGRPRTALTKPQSCSGRPRGPSRRGLRGGQAGADRRLGLRQRLTGARHRLGDVLGGEPLGDGAERLSGVRDRRSGVRGTRARGGEGGTEGGDLIGRQWTAARCTRICS
ncbi:hypothetical protein M2160_008800 [Streptomyces sp. SAI-117]|nr:hypothetical protein [Streptomyces sp. SAI-117]